mmetsp:Transcript_59270/g.72501  ORF Transcript_59270/g.72501 Transcript_59270/m.72501 type:complete len:101 (-) Transcript_59270:27-329(-)
MHAQNIVLQHEGTCHVSRLTPSAEELKGQLVRSQHDDKARHCGDFRDIGLIVIGLHLQSSFPWTQKHEDHDLSAGENRTPIAGLLIRQLSFFEVGVAGLM